MGTVRACGDHHCVGHYGLLLSQDGQEGLRLPRGRVPQLCRFAVKPVGVERLGSGATVLYRAPRRSIPPPLLPGFSRIRSTVMAHPLNSLRGEGIDWHQGPPMGVSPPLPLCRLCPSILAVAGPAHGFPSPALEGLGTEDRNCSLLCVS